MIASIDREGCISCGLCTSICPSVFEMGEDGPANVIVDCIPSELEADAMEAQDSCPVAVITID